MTERGNTTRDQPAEANAPRSCCILELSVAGGGFRRGEIWVVASLADIRQPLEQELMSGDPEAAYLAVCYGETMALWVIQRGQLAARIDLRPFIRLKVDGHPMVPLSEQPAAWLEPIASAVTEHYNGDAEHAVRFEIDWDGMAARLPALQPPLLGPEDHGVLDVSHAAQTLLHDAGFTIISDGMTLELGRHVLGS